MKKGIKEAVCFQFQINVIYLHLGFLFISSFIFKNGWTEVSQRDNILQGCINHVSNKPLNRLNKKIEPL